MNQKAQSKMTTNETPSPLELAHLSIALVQAGMLPNTELPYQRIVQSLDYLRMCSSILLGKEDAEERIKEWAPQKQFLSKFGDGENVPLEAILKYCNAQRIKPSQNELQEIGETRHWEQLSKAEQMSSIYLVLTNKVNPPRDAVVPLERRRQWIAEGFPQAGAIVALVDLPNAKKRRQSEKGTAGAEIKRRKPRAPKGDKGKYEQKARSNVGKYKKQ